MVEDFITSYANRPAKVETIYGVTMVTLPELKDHRIVLTAPLENLQGETDRDMAVRYLKDRKAVVIDVSIWDLLS